MKTNILDALKGIIKELSDLVAEMDTAEVGKEEPKRKVTLSEVRAFLADLSRDGYRADVKKLLTNHKANKLSEVNEDEYEALLAEAQEVRNAR